MLINVKSGNGFFHRTLEVLSRTLIKTDLFLFAPILPKHLSIAIKFPLNLYPELKNSPFKVEKAPGNFFN